jgi:nitrogen fixation NifU-like protein
VSTQALYKEQLLDHARKPRNRGDLDDAEVRCRGSNPRCGDEVELGLYLEDGTLSQLRFQGRGCSICMASASLLTETATGSLEEAASLCDAVHEWFSGAEPEAPAPRSELAALGPVRSHPARHRCVLLSWDALRQALTDLDSPHE